MNTKPSLVQSFSTRKAKIIVGLALLLPLVVVLGFAKLTYPLHEGTSLDFWKDACGISLDGQEIEAVGGFYPPRNGWCIYYLQGYHGQFLFRVPRSEVTQNFPKAIAKLKEPIGTNDLRVTQWTRSALANPSAETSFDNFLTSVRDEKFKAFNPCLKLPAFTCAENGVVMFP